MHPAIYLSWFCSSLVNHKENYGLTHGLGAIERGLILALWMSNLTFGALKEPLNKVTEINSEHKTGLVAFVFITNVIYYTKIMFWLLYAA